MSGFSAASPTFADSSAAVSHTVRTSAAPDARTVFRGVFFGHGPLGERLARYHRGAPEATPAHTSLEDVFMDRLEARDPRVIDEVRAAALSGSHVRTRTALRTASDALSREVREAEADGTGLGGVSGTCLFLVAVVIQYVYAAQTLWGIQWNWTAATGESFRTEELVHDLITHIA
ncbi:hypothetical protein [Streptomyces pratensis]|uniref:hypothetical protein n=1 Tax=Streptomyces pratensis TaxID=1169025 RepID=UPI0036329FB2